MTETQPDSENNLPQAAEAVVSPSSSIKARALRLLTHPKAPIWAAGTILGVVALVACWHLRGAAGLSLGPLGRPAFVLFDPVRFTNAQRAAASILAVSPNSDLALSLTQVAKQAEPVIQEEAHGAVVLVKQAVVAPDGLVDITEAVLVRFGLPTNVPTITTSLKDESLEGLAPTDNAFSSGKLREDYRLELQNKSSKLAAEQARQASQANILP